MAPLIPIGLQILSTGALIAGSAALIKSLKPKEPKQPKSPLEVLATEPELDPAVRGARQKQAERRRRATARGRGSTILTRNLLAEPNVNVQTLGGA